MPRINFHTDKRLVARLPAHDEIDETPSVAPFKRPGDWKPKVRDAAIRKIKKRLGKKVSQKRISQELDMLDLPIPEEWAEEFEVSLWIDAYAHPDLRNRVKKMISSA